MYIYVIECEQGKYYVGKTIYSDFNLDTHFNRMDAEWQRGNAWVRVYSPLRVVEFIPDCTDWDEDKYTLMYMKKHGIGNVRGGSFYSWKLDVSDIKTIQKMLMCDGELNYDNGDCIELIDRGCCWNILSYYFP